MIQTIINEVVLQHAEEAAFQWVLRDTAVAAPHYDVKDLAELDDKVDAHLDGLRIAGDTGWELCQEELSWQEPGEVFTAGVLTFESDVEDRIEQVLEIATQEVELSRGLISALGWLPFEQAKPAIKNLIESHDPARRRIGIAAASVHRQPGQPSQSGRVNSDPDQWVKPNTLLNAIQHGDPLLRARAMRAAGELGRADLAVAILPHLDDKHESIRFWAAWSCAVLNQTRAIPVLQALATTTPDGIYAERAADLASRCLPPPEAVAWQKQLAATANLRRIAVKVAGAIGDPGAGAGVMDWLFEVMEDQDCPECHRVAGEAYAMITGVDLAYDDLDRDEPEGFEAGPTEDENDENVALDPDEDLPWPNPDLVKARWSTQQANFSVGTRYLLGQPMNNEATLTEALKAGMQRQRAAAAIELALRQSDRPLFEVRGRGDRQRIALGLTRK